MCMTRCHDTFDLRGDAENLGDDRKHPSETDRCRLTNTRQVPLERHQPDFLIYLGASRGKDIIGTPHADFDGRGTKSSQTQMKILCLAHLECLMKAFDCNQFEALHAFKKYAGTRYQQGVQVGWTNMCTACELLRPRLVPVLCAPQALSTCTQQGGAGAV